jgi:hypothetical protein
MFATSPDRYGFMIDLYKKRLEKNPDNLEMQKTMGFYETCRALDALDDAKENDLSCDLRRCEWIVCKCKSSKPYSQNLYAALCNNSFSKNGNKWSCSWRSSGGLVSNLREEGDYIDWYCSGMPADWDLPVKQDYVGEGVVTEEVRDDLVRLGWSLVS